MNRRKVIVFVSGAYRSKNPLVKLINILRARHYAKKLWAMGFTVICPQSNSAWFPEDGQLEGYLEILLGTKVLFAVRSRYIQIPLGFSRIDLRIFRGVFDSEGATMEINKAWAEGIPVFYSLEEIEKAYPPEADKSD